MPVFFGTAKLGRGAALVQGKDRGGSVEGLLERCPARVPTMSRSTSLEIELERRSRPTMEDHFVPCLSPEQETSQDASDIISETLDVAYGVCACARQQGPVAGFPGAKSSLEGPWQGGACSCLECLCMDNPSTHCGCACGGWGGNGRPPADSLEVTSDPALLWQEETKPRITGGKVYWPDLQASAAPGQKRGAEGLCHSSDFARSRRRRLETNLNHRCGSESAAAQEVGSSAASGKCYKPGPVSAGYGSGGIGRWCNDELEEEFLDYLGLAQPSEGAGVGGGEEDDWAGSSTPVADHALLSASQWEAQRSLAPSVVETGGCRSEAAHGEGASLPCQRTRGEEGRMGWAEPVGPQARPAYGEPLRASVDVSLSCLNRCTGASDVIGAIDFDASGEHFATGGVARMIRVYSLESLQLAACEAQRDDSEVEAEEEEGDESGAEDDRRERRRHRRGSRGRSGSAHGAEPSRGGHSDLGSYPGSAMLHHEKCAIKLVRTPAKLSSLKWVPGRGHLIACGDLDGVVTEWDCERGGSGLAVCERDEHSGQRVWSIDYSRSTPGLSASGADDGTVRLWAASSDHSVGAIRTESGRPVCSVEFSPESERLIAVASADSCVYLHDLRSMGRPLCTLQGHSRTVSYARFMGQDLLASSSIDSTIRVWDVSASAMAVGRGGSDAGLRRAPLSSRVPFAPAPSWVGMDSGASHAAEGGTRWPHSPGTGLSCGLTQRGGPAVDSFIHPTMVLEGHQNRRNFVGLAVKGEGGDALIATGTEENEVVVYSVGAQWPVLSLDFSPERSQAARSEHVSAAEAEQEEERVRSRRPFVSALAWQVHNQCGALVAANSEGVVRIISMH